MAAWGYFLYQGVVDPLGGINTLWPLFGIANQMLAAIALMLGTVVLFKMKRERYAWVTIVPTAWLLVCTLTAGWQKLFSTEPEDRLRGACARSSPTPLAQGMVLAPAKSPEQMQRIVFNDCLDAALAAFFMLVVLSVLVYGVRGLAARRGTAERAGIALCLPRPARMAWPGSPSRRYQAPLSGAKHAPDGWPARLRTYVTHMEATHPGQAPMSYEEFFRERQEARYGGAGKRRCC